MRAAPGQEGPRLSLYPLEPEETVNHKSGVRFDYLSFAGLTLKEVDNPRVACRFWNRNIVSAMFC